MLTGLVREFVISLAHIQPKRIAYSCLIAQIKGIYVCVPPTVQNEGVKRHFPS